MLPGRQPIEASSLRLRPPEAAMLQSLRLCSRAVTASGTARLRCSQLQGSRASAGSRPLIVRTMASEVERAQAA